MTRRDALIQWSLLLLTILVTISFVWCLKTR